jgi:hypothetical protein
MKNLIIILLILSPFIYIGFSYSNSKQGTLYRLDAGLEPSDVDYWYIEPGEGIPLIATYEGDIKNAKPDGIGTLTYISGNRHEGYFKDGRPDGQGWEFRVNGNRIEGEWLNGRRWNVTEYDINGNIVRKIENSWIKNVFKYIDMITLIERGATFSGNIIAIFFGSLVHLLVLFCIYRRRENILRYFKQITNPNVVIELASEWYDNLSSPHKLGFQKYIWHIILPFYYLSGLIFTIIFCYGLFHFTFADFLVSSYLIYILYILGLFLSPFPLIVLYMDVVSFP